MDCVRSTSLFYKRNYLKKNKENHLVYANLPLILSLNHKERDKAN